MDEAIEAMRLTAQDMSHKYKETSLSVCLLFMTRRFIVSDSLVDLQGLAVSSLKKYCLFIVIKFFTQTTVKIPLSVPAC